MESLKEYLQIAHWIVKQKLLGLTETESESLSQWKQKKEQNQKDFNSLEKIDVAELSCRYEKVNTSYQWEIFQRKIAGKVRFRWLTYGSVAAGICLLLGISWNLFSDKQPETWNVVEKTPQKAIQLILSDGSSVNLSAKREREKLPIAEGKVVIREGLLEYQQDTVQAVINTQNTLVIPPGAFYHLILSDGTKVWLNSGTRITYPVEFAGNTREVTLSGEAYFDVVKNPDCPFVVKTDLFNVKVLGTSFNVSTYGDDGKAYTALERGVVEISNGVENALVLAPGQVAEVEAGHPGGLLRLSASSLEQHIAWKDGIFCFRRAALPDILKQVGRYYDVHFVNAEQLEGEYYTGDISRNVSLEALLTAISAQTTRLRFQVVERTVYIIKERD